MTRKKQALIGKRFEGFHMDPMEILIVGIDVESNADLAHLYDERCHDPVDDAMVRNIMVYGVVEPIIVTKIGPDDAYVVDGRGRLLANREANVRLAAEGKPTRRIPVITRKGAAHELFGVSVSANELRRDDNPILRAEKAQRYLYLGRDIEEAAVAFGVSSTAVKQWLVLLDLAPSVKKMVKTGKLSAHAASTLAKLPLDEQVKAAKEALATAQETGKKPTGKTMSQKTGATTPVTPPKRIVQRIVEEKPSIKPEHDNFWSALEFMMGNLTPEQVGVDTVFAKVAKEKAAKAKKAAEKKANKGKKKPPAKKAKKKAPAKKTGPTIAKKRAGKTAAA